MVRLLAGCAPQAYLHLAVGQPSSDVLTLIPNTHHLPQALDRASAVFRDFYLSKYSGRRLAWQHSLGSCVLRAQFPKGLKELSVSTFQVGAWAKRTAATGGKVCGGGEAAGDCAGGSWGAGERCI